MLEALRKSGAEARTLELPVGHYSLELAPFSYIAGAECLRIFWKRWHKPEKKI